MGLPSFPCPGVDGRIYGHVPRIVSSESTVPKELELLLIAFDASYGNAFGPYTRHHIKNAFKAGATTDEIMQVLKLGVIRWMQACTLGVSILAEELERSAASQRPSA